MKPIGTGAPIGEIVQQMLLPGSGATGTYGGLMTVTIPINATSTSNAATNWINPETSTVIAKVFLAVRTAGTGTIDVGRSDNGTGSNNDILDGNTLAIGVFQRVGTNATLGVANDGYILIGPGGTGTNNSIVAVHTDTTTSTCVGRMVIQYFLI